MLKIFWKLYAHFEITVSNMFQKGWDRDMFTTVLYNHVF